MYSTTKKLWLLLLCCMNSVVLLAQVVKIEGRVINAETSTPVPFASLGVAGKDIGTIADEQGHFLFRVDKSQLPPETKVVISCIGFVKQEIASGEFYKNPSLEIRLQPQAVTLNEVTIKPNQLRPKVLGNKGRSPFASFNYYTVKDSTAYDKLGREIASIIKVKGNCMLEQFNFCVAMNEFTHIKLRLNIYNLDAKGMPDQSLLRQDIIIELNGETNQWIRVDLKKYQIYLEDVERVAVGLQWISSKSKDEKSRYFNIPAAISATHVTLTRDKSLAEWTKTGANLSMYFDASCERDED